LAGLGFGVIVLLRMLGARSVAVYFLVGVGIWLAFLKSGVHPTVAGVLLGLLAPAHSGVGRPMIVDLVGELVSRIAGAQTGTPPPTAEMESPAEQLENALHPWVAFAIMPIFALANAGVKFDLGVLGTPVAMAVCAALVVGKPLGVLLFSWASVRLGIAHLPEGLNWRVLLGAGCLAGIGFTMSLFIAGLAFDDRLLGEAKIGVLAGSGLSASFGCGLLYSFLPRTEREGVVFNAPHTHPPS
jgi:NhaA family Na+:H+ antiporter